MIIGFAYVLSLFLGILQDVVASEGIALSDHRIAHLMVNFRSPAITPFFLWITLLGKWQIILGSAIVVSVIFWIWKRRDLIAYLWLALTSNEIFNHVVKLLIHRDRPAHPIYIEHSFSFPSGHAMTAIVFYGFLAYILIRHMKNWGHKISVFFACLLVILAIGFSRLYLGVHYVSDVWAGYLLGFLVLTVIITLYEWHPWRSEKQKHEAVIAKPGLRPENTIYRSCSK
jgi:membrane-associated phospholipid phosphatase